MFENLKKFNQKLKQHKTELAVAGATIASAGTAVAASVPVGMADTGSNGTLDLSSIGTMLDSITTVIPHLMNFVVAIVPLIIELAIVGALLYLIVELFRKIPEMLNKWI